MKYIAYLFCLTLFSLQTSFAQENNQAVILQYHHVSSDTPAVTSLSLNEFRVHMAYLQDNNFQLMRLESVITSLQQGITLPEKTAVITFDDGYLSVYTEAFPLLEQLGWPFTVFVSTGLVGSNENLYANWAQIKQMALAGATIANHTVNHLHLLEILPGEQEDAWRERISHEITQAEADISQYTGQNHKLLAFPYGEYNPAITALIEELGFVGIAQHSGPINEDSDFTALPRFPFSGNYASMNTFPTKVNSLTFSLDSLSPISPITESGQPSAQIHFSDENYALEQLTCYNNGERISSQAIDDSSRRYLIESHINNETRRFRYNCTAPSGSGRYYWYSIPWINPNRAE